MKAETKVVLHLERFARSLIRWTKDEEYIFGEHSMQAERISLCEKFGADVEKVYEMEQELIERRMEKSWAW